jgi:hypothetical protein
MDLRITAEEVKITAIKNYKYCIELEIEGVNENDLNTKEVAACISCEAFFEAKGEDEIMEYVKAHYDWFDKKEEE